MLRVRPRWVARGAALPAPGLPSTGPARPGLTRWAGIPTLLLPTHTLPDGCGLGSSEGSLRAPGGCGREVCRAPGRVVPAAPARSGLGTTEPRSPPAVRAGSIAASSMAWGFRGALLASCLSGEETEGLESPCRLRCHIPGRIFGVPPPPARPPGDIPNYPMRRGRPP